MLVYRSSAANADASAALQSEEAMISEEQLPLGVVYVLQIF